MKRPRIVIVGAGAGGLPLAAWLGRAHRKAFDVVLVDQFLTHVWKPLLHELAVGTLTSNEDEVNLFAHGQEFGYEFVLGEMCGLDRQRQCIQLAPVMGEEGDEVLPAREENYDVLVMAVGSESNDFGTPGVREHALFLDDKAGAEHFHREFIHSLLRSNFLMKDESSSLDVVIVGAGATGVELSAQVQEVLSRLRSYGLRDFDARRARVVLIEAGDRCVPFLDARIGERVKRELEEMGVEVMLGKHVESIGDRQVRIKDHDPIPARLVVWCAGTRSHDWLGSLGLEADKRGRLIVSPTLQSVTDPSIFILGDCASVDDGHGGVVPTLAQAAFQEAAYLRDAIPRFVSGGSPARPFRFTHRGSLVSLASEDAVGNLMGKYVKNLGIYGTIARLAYLSLYRRHQFAILGVRQTLVAMLKTLLSTAPGGRLKLH